MKRKRKRRIMRRMRVPRRRMRMTGSSRRSLEVVPQGLRKPYSSQKLACGFYILTVDSSTQPRRGTLSGSSARTCL